MKSRMDNPDKLVTLGTQYTGRWQKKQKTTTKQQQNKTKQTNKQTKHSTEN